MYIIRFIVVTAFYLSFIDCVKFRADYNYHEEVNGWLKLHRIPATWQDAYRTCFYEGGVLASPENENLLTAMKKVLNGSCGIFTGTHATFGKGHYFSVEGMALSEMPVEWAPDEPDNYENDEDCLFMLADGHVADVNCSRTHPFICYKKETSDMVMNLKCGTTDQEYVLDSATGSCYKFHREPQTWYHAVEACADEGGHLVVLNSQKEAQVVKDLFAKNPESSIPGVFNKDHIHIGFRDFSDHGLWLTIHGQTLKKAGFDKWSAYEPDNQNNRQYCGNMFRTGLLDDEDCNKPFFFVCEKNPKSLMTKSDGSAVSPGADTGKTTCGSGYLLDNRTRSCHKFYRGPLSWPEAFMSCAAEKAHLAIINSEAEAMTLTELIRSNSGPTDIPAERYVYIGFHHWGLKGDFKTIHGQTLAEAGFNSFCTYEPNHLDSEFCGAMTLESCLHNIRCNPTLPYICEKTHDTGN